VRLRAVTWNIHSCVGVDRAYDPERVAVSLEGLGADVVALQEVDWRTPRVRNLDQLDLLAERLGLAAAAGPCLTDHRGEYGNGLLTRHRIVAHRTTITEHPGAEPRGVLDAELDVDGAPLRVLVTHLGLSRLARRAQVTRLLELLDAPSPGGAPDPPTLLMGDLNEWLPLRLAARRLYPGAFPTGASARTFPARWPLLRLDRALVRPRPASMVARAPKVPGSDHLPLVVDLEF